ncbi:MAG: AbrB/MazE/SpoVT family DNA-binding domain-containing protein [Thermoplasmata archaeon]|nr:MAG: AbrB/MazE/SpoVT family DNA-binding domain-containing protein [Thermoplasmata archaeon]
MTKCPMCEKGVLKKKKIEEKMFGISLGKFTAEVCDKCGESFLDENAMRKIEEKAKELGIWGLAKDIKIVKSGNSLSVRIPAKIARFLELYEGKDVLLYPEGKKKIIVEVT